MEQDKFDKTRTSVWGLPGFDFKASTVRADALALIPQGTYIIETVRHSEGWAIFIQGISSEGANRIVLPDKVATTLWNHYEKMKKRNVKKHILKARQRKARKARERAKQNSQPQLESDSAGLQPFGDLNGKE